MSLVRLMSDGTLVEVRIVGREGFVGLAAVLGGGTGGIPMVLIPGSALAIPTAALLKEVDRCPVLAARMLRYGEALLIQISQTAACNTRRTKFRSGSRGGSSWRAIASMTTTFRSAMSSCR